MRIQILILGFKGVKRATASLVGRAETDNRGLNHVCVRKVTQIMYRAAARIF